MLRRVVILAALAVVLGSSLGMAAERVFTREITVDPVKIDTADHLVGGFINDSLILNQIEWRWGASRNFSEIVGRVIKTALDTAFEDDSVTFTLQTKFDSDYDSTWWTIWTSAIQADVDYEAGLAVYTVNVPVDSMVSLGDAFRMQTIFHAEEDSIRLHTNASSTAGHLDLAHKWLLYLTFRLR